MEKNENFNPHQYMAISIVKSMKYINESLELHPKRTYSVLIVIVVIMLFMLVVLPIILYSKENISLVNLLILFGVYAFLVGYFMFFIRPKILVLQKLDTE